MCMLAYIKYNIKKLGVMFKKELLTCLSLCQDDPKMKTTRMTLSWF